MASENGENGNNGKLIGMLMTVVMVAMGWLVSSIWQLHDAIDKKADHTEASDRWTGSQMREYRNYVDSRFIVVEERINECRGKK